MNKWFIIVCNDVKLERGKYIVEHNMDGKKKRILYLILGNILIGVGTGFCRKAAFGVDPFACMGLSFTQFFNGIGLSFMTYGTCLLIENAILFAVVWFTERKYMGVGTFVNMIGVGYVVDIVTFIFNKMGFEPGTVIRACLLVVGIVVIALGIAMYTVADMGLAPYDTVAYILMKYTNNKVSFRAGRIGSDVTVMIIGIIVCLIGGYSVFTVLGIGTAMGVVMFGPLIQWFKDRL